MEKIQDFNQLLEHLKNQKLKKRVAVVCPRDESTQQALKKAERDGFIEPLMVDDDDLPKAARKAIQFVREGKADFLMKGLINSDILLHAILNREEGLLQPGHVLTQMACSSIPDYHKFLFYTDAAVIPYPTQQQRIEQVRYMASLCRTFGIAEPRISLIHCSEKVDERHFPFTAGYADIIRMAKEGEFGKCLIDGPLDLKTSCSPSSLKVKGISSPLGGDADALIFPDIEGGNLFHKTITFFAHAETASILQGTMVPVVMPSRADSPETKYYSLALAAILTSNT